VYINPSTFTFDEYNETQTVYVEIGNDGYEGVLGNDYPGSSSIVIVAESPDDPMMYKMSSPIMITEPLSP